MKTKTYKACIDYVTREFSQKNNPVAYWKVTEKSLVVYDLDGKRTVVPLKDLAQEVE